MPTNYARGRNFEYRVIAALKKLDYYCIRSAGSHGPIDIIAFKDGEMLFVQCKKTKALPARKIIAELIEISKHGRAEPVIAHMGPKREVVFKTGKELEK